MCSPSEVIIVSPSFESSSSFIPTVEILKKFDIPHRFVSPSLQETPKNSKSVFCLIVRADSDCIQWANHFYPNTPKLLVSKAIEGDDALEALIQTALQPIPDAMPTFAIGKAGEINAAIFAAAMLSLRRRDIRKKLLQFRKDQTQAVLARSIPGE